MKIINRVTQSNGILCYMEDGSRWLYTKGAMNEWTQCEESDDDLQKSFDKKDE